MDIKEQLRLNLTHKEIFEKEFTKKFRGFDEYEVNYFLDLIIHDYKIMMNEIESLRRQLNEKNHN